ncbi:MAG TPA: vtpJ-therm [Deltaproteobacteria bacterium]|nr:vtpJ-therm [Deltaproteobacteria bacterium]
MSSLHYQSALLLLLISCGTPKSDSASIALGPTWDPSDPRFQFLGETVVAEEEVDGIVTTRTFDPESGPMCLRGEPFRASTRSTGSNDLVIFLQGGGACWDDFCLAVTSAPSGVPAVDVLNADLPENPLAEWNVTYLPYCDGSLFIGNRDLDEDGDGTPDRFHRGLANLSAALDMSMELFPDPDRVLLVGSSGGGFGVLLAPPIVRAAYPNADLSVFADSAVGVARGPAEPDFVLHLMDQWGAEPFLPPGCGRRCVENGHMTGVVAENLRVDPQLRMAVFTAWYDMIIGDIFLQVPPSELAAEMDRETTALAERYPDRYRRFIIDGRMHTTLLGDPTGIVGSDLGAVELPPDVLTALANIELGSLVDTTSASGHRVADWLADFAARDAAWTDHVDPSGPVP